MKERIEKIKPYFVGMRVDTTEDGNAIIFIEINYPPQWILDNDILEKHGVIANRGQEYQGQYFIGADMETGFDAIFDAVEENIAKMRVAEERATLLNISVAKLRKMFADETLSIEELKSIKLTYVTSVGLEKEYGAVILPQAETKVTKENKKEKKQ